MPTYRELDDALGLTNIAGQHLVDGRTWFGAPFFMIMYLASLKSVPEQLYEAAAIDGATWWQRARYVTLPMMRNIIAITVLSSLIGTFASVRHLRVQHRHSERRLPVGRQRVTVHAADPGGGRDLHPARRHQAGE